MRRESWTEAGSSEEPGRRSRGLGACGAGSCRPHALYSVSGSEELSGRLGLGERAAHRGGRAREAFLEAAVVVRRRPGAEAPELIGWGWGGERRGEEKGRGEERGPNEPGGTRAQNDADEKDRKGERDRAAALLLLY